MNSKKYAPQKLYVVGTILLPLKKPRVAVVGTRQPSSFTIKLTEKIVRKPFSRGVVVSGLARGIDTTAHLSTMQSGGKTIAVLGTPLTRFHLPRTKPPAANHERTSHGKLVPVGTQN